MRLAVGTLTLATGLLVALGLTMLHSIGMHDPKGLLFFHQQARWLVVGVVGCLLAATIDYRRTRMFAYLFLVAVAVCLVMARTPGIGHEVKGGWRWLKLGAFTFQPSEFAKLALIMAIAAYADSCQRLLKRPLYGLVFPGAAIGLVLLLILAGKDLGTTALMALLSASMLFAAGTRLRHLIPVGILVAIGLGTYLATDPVRWRRVDAFMHPERYEETIAMQSEESKVAIGSGGPLGVGLGNGIHKSGYVPDQWTDFIFSVIGEELGLRVSLPVLATYVAFTLAALAIARRASNTYGAMIAFGGGMLVGAQAVLNIAVTTGSVPNKGIALPFVSYGGTCLVVMLTLVGLILNVAIRSSREEEVADLPESTDREPSVFQGAS
ncbi:MAG: FtsW/RodA/SpoVE family cell cycle protein [Verrucomicrobiales bacterium]|nr:FtsW/RodA/SpoVE family cell cycle protein [Verrucomicrobiales bacterium]